MAGRKNKYHSHVEPNFEVIQGLLRSGHTEKSIAKSLGVGVSSWDNYKNQFPVFMELLKKGVMNATALVVNALHKRATGYEYDEIHTEITDTGAQQAQPGQTGQPLTQRRVIRKTTKQVPPDTAACIFWVTNRDPANWKNTQNIKHSGEVKTTGVLLREPPKSREEWLEIMQNVKSEEPSEPEKKKQ